VRILFWVVRALAILLLLRMVVRMLFGDRRPQRHSGASQPRNPERLGGELVRDPQCGTYIPKARAIVAGSGEAAQYFCSTTCRDTYVTSHV
jgi:hypothetical protein